MQSIQVSITKVREVKIGGDYGEGPTPTHNISGVVTGSESESDCLAAVISALRAEGWLPWCPSMYRRFPWREGEMSYSMSDRGAPSGGRITFIADAIKAGTATIGDWTYTLDDRDDNDITITVVPSRILTLDEQGVSLCGPGHDQGPEGSIEIISDMQADTEDVLLALGLAPEREINREHGWVLGDANDNDGMHKRVQEGDQIEIYWTVGVAS